MRPVALSIAGSDSGGGAGIQADLRVFHRLGAFGTTVVTAVTAQNLGGVTGVIGIEPTMVGQQIDAVTSGFEVRAVKTGMLWSADIVREVARALGEVGMPVIVDPVMVATSGARLVDEDAIDAYRSDLLGRATLVTPNLDEAAVLLDTESVADRRSVDIADELFERLGCAVLLKGGHMSGDPVDVLRSGDGRAVWRHARVLRVNTHGTGCMLSAAVAASMALGYELEPACARALAFVHDALERGALPGGGTRLADIEHAEPTASHLQRIE